jgi:N-acetylmuramoyl-L-alanine amidase
MGFLPPVRSRSFARVSAAVLSVLLLAACSTQSVSTVRTERSARAPTTTTVSASTTPSMSTTTALTTTKAPQARRSVAPAAASSPAPQLPLAGRTVGIDPGHNGGNFDDPGFINRLIWDGRAMKVCNTTGTATASGYTEAQYNFNVASDLAADLRGQGARVVMTRHSNTGVGPCTNTRAQIINSSGAEVAISIHADGGPVDGRGFAILEPVADGPNDHVIGDSERFGRDVLAQYQEITGMPTSTYDGTGGIVFRDDLTGLNLTTVPEVLIETGNMQNATDAAMLTSPSFQRLAAKALDRAIVQYLTVTP